MITFYSGTPGSGKSLNMARDIYFNLTIKKRPVIANFPIDYESLSKKNYKKVAKFTYVNNQMLTVEYLYNYAYKNHALGKEGQIIVCIDECQVLFNPREFSRIDRLPWITFFTQHRKLGYHFILVSQNDRLVDRQIRSLFEYEVKHRKLNNFGPFVLLPMKTFIAITYWYTVKERVERKVFIHKRKHSKLYDSFMMFEGSIKGINNKAQENEIKKAMPANAVEGLGVPFTEVVGIVESYEEDITIKEKYIVKVKEIKGKVSEKIKKIKEKISKKKVKTM